MLEVLFLVSFYKQNLIKSFTTTIVMQLNLAGSIWKSKLTITTLIKRTPPLCWKVSSRLSSASENLRTSLTSCMMYSGSPPGGVIAWSRSIALRGLVLELRPISCVLWELTAKGTTLGWDRWAPLVKRLFPLFLPCRNIPAATSAVTEPPQPQIQAPSCQWRVGSTVGV